jgi:hypothetical protein
MDKSIRDSGALFCVLGDQGGEWDSANSPTKKESNHLGREALKSDDNFVGPLSATPGLKSMAGKAIP